MPTYEYGRIRVLDKKLHSTRVAPHVVQAIMQGGEDVKRSTTPEAKADWMRGAMARMDDLLNAETRQAVREACACCLGGKRGATSKAIGRDHPTLEARVQAANEARFVFGHSVTLQEDGQVLVRFAPEGQGPYGCPCLPKARQPLSMTHCYCCGGHVKHHLQHALVRKLSVTVLSSSLASGGEKPCAFLFRFVDG